MEDKKNSNESGSEANANKDGHAPFIFKFDADLGIADAKTLSEDLGDLLKEQSELVLDVSEIENVDTAVLQLLLAFLKEHKGFRWKMPSENLFNSASLLDLDQHLGLNSSFTNDADTQDIL